MTTYSNDSATLTDNDLLAPFIIEPQGNTEQLVNRFIFHGANLYETESTTLEISAKFYETVINGEIPESVDPVMLNNMALHRPLADAGYYGRITKQVARGIAANVGNSVVLDLMAGRGYAVKALREAGVRTIATDDNSWELSSGIEQLDALASIDKYGDQIGYILMSWVPNESLLDYEILVKIRNEYPHIRIIHIGENYSGATGSEKFLEEAEYCPTEYPVIYQNLGTIYDTLNFMK